MTTKTLLMAAGGILAVIIAALLYHHCTVAALESRLAEANDCLRDEQQAFTDFQTSLARQTLNALQTNAATVEKMLSEREERHEAIRAAGHSALAAIAAETAATGGKPAEPTPDKGKTASSPAQSTANCNRPLPRAVSAELLRLYNAASAAGSGAHPSSAAGSPVPGKSPAAAAAGDNNRSTPGQLDNPVADMGG
jgi:hypothetical protein